MATNTVQVDLEATHRLAERLYLAIPQGTTAPQAELALLLAYCGVAEGIQAFPESTRLARSLYIVAKASAEICRLIEIAGRMSDADLKAFFAAAGISV